MKRMISLYCNENKSDNITTPIVSLSLLNRIYW